MEKAFPTASWFVLATVCTLLGILLASGSVWAQTATAPGAPTIDSLTIGNESITVAWTAPASNGGSDITSYDLRYISSDATDKAGANWTVESGVWSSGVLRYTLGGLTNGTEYDVQMRAVNADGAGAWSATVSGKPATIPSAPFLWPSVAKNLQIYIIWSSPDSDGGSDITSYDLRYIRTDATDLSNANWTLMEDVRTGASTYTITGLTNGVAYHVEVRGVNAAGDGLWSNRITKTPVGPPGVPSINTVTPGDRSLTITWSAPADNGGADIIGYNLRYIRNDSTDFAYPLWNFEDGIWTSGDLEYTLGELDNDVRYRLSLQAVNSQGPSNWSHFDNLRTGTPGDPPELPAAPTIDRTVSNGASMDIKWSAPADDGGADITSYDLRYIRNDTQDKADANWTVQDSAWTSGDLEYTLTGLASGVKYDTQVRAVNSVGAGPWSATATSAPATVPDAPFFGLHAFWDRTLWFSWIEPDDDGGAPVTSYDMRYVRTDVDSDWTLLETVTTTDHSYRIRGLTNHVEYTVQLRAVNRAGPSPWTASIVETPRKGLPPPVNVSVTPGDRSLTITWSAPATQEGVTITGYHVRHIERDSPRIYLFDYWTTSDVIPASDPLEYTITGLTNGVEYEIQVESLNSYYGDTNRFSTRNAVHGVPGTVPSTVTNLKRILTAESSIFISWYSPNDNGGSTINRYDIHHHPTSDPTMVVEHSQAARDIILGRTLNNRWVENLTPHVEYNIKVRARNRTGAGPWSSLTLIPRRKPVELTIDSLTPGDGTLTVGWTDGGDDEIVSYEVRYTDLFFPSDVGPDSPEWEYHRNITGTSPLEYTIDGLNNGVQYKVQVRGRNKYGVLPSDWGNWAPYWQHGIPRTTPGAPAIGSVTPGDETLTVAWSAPSDDGGAGVTGYDLRYIRSDATDKADANWTVNDNVWSSGELLYNLIGLTNGVGYDLQVRAVNSAGEGDWSSTHNGTPGGAPDAPTLDLVTPGDETLAVAWSAPSDDGGADVTGYDLRYIRSDASNKADANWTVESGVWSSGVLRYELGGLANGVGYDVQVRTVNAAGNGPWSSTVSATPLTVPGRPGSTITVTPGDETLAVAWSAPSDDGGADVTGYDLRHIRSDASNKADANWTVESGVWSSGVLRYSLGGLANGVGYDVQVRAVNSVGPGAWSGSGNGNGKPRTTPGAPSVNSPTPGDGVLTVTWSAPSDDGGAGVTGYDLRYIRSDATDKADANWTVNDSVWSSGELRYNLIGLTNGVGYDLQVRAVNSAGEGDWSTTVSATPLTVPGRPGSTITVTPGDETLMVAWSAPSDDGGADVTGYDLRYIRSDAPSKADANWTVEPGIWTSGVLRYELGGLTNGVEYDVQVRAVNIAGEGPWSGSGAGKPRTTPGAPSVNSLTPGDGVLAVAWSVPGSNGGAAITGYDLRYIRSDAPNKADANWTVETGIWSSGELRYELGGLTNGVEYDVQVRAGNIAGGGQWSGSITGTPQTIPAAPKINSVVSGDRALTVTWSAPADTGGLAIQSYDLRYIVSSAPDKADANWSGKQGVGSSTSPQDTITGLTNGDLYDVQLRGGHQRREWPLVGLGLRHPADSAAGPGHQLNHPRRQCAGRSMVRPRGQWRVRHHILRPALHPEPTRRTRPTPTGAGSRTSGAPRACNTHHHRVEQRGRVRRAGAGGQHRRRRALVQHPHGHAPGGPRSPPA